MCNLKLCVTYVLGFSFIETCSLPLFIRGRKLGTSKIDGEDKI